MRGNQIMMGDIPKLPKSKEDVKESEATMKVSVAGGVKVDIDN